MRKWVPIEPLPGHEDVVHSVAWAPNIGRSVCGRDAAGRRSDRRPGSNYHLIATACKDRRVRIFKLREHEERFKVESVGSFEDHDAEVWRVEWNVTGTVLSSSGDDGKVRLWKGALALPPRRSRALTGRRAQPANYLDEWRCITVINAGDSRQAPPA